MVEAIPQHSKLRTQVLIDVLRQHFTSAAESYLSGFVSLAKSRTDPQDAMKMLSSDPEASAAHLLQYSVRFFASIAAAEGFKSRFT